MANMAIGIKKIFTLTFLCTLVALVAAVCCQGCDAPLPASEQDACSGIPPRELGEPQSGGRLVLGVTADASSLIEGLASDSVSNDVTRFLYVSPVRYNQDLELEPWAADYEILDGGLRLRFTLKPGILWDDGVEITADDVAFTYEVMTDPDTPTPYAENFLEVKEFRVLDRYTFEAVYDEVYARSLITWAQAILPRHALEGEDLMDTEFSRNPLCSGPYRLAEWIPGQRIVLEARDEYFQGRPFLDSIIFRIIPDSATMFQELKSGGLDMMLLTPQQYMYESGGGGCAPTGWERDYTRCRYLDFNYTYLGYNLENPLFSDVRVRQALAHAIDKQEIIAGALLGQGVPTIGPYSPGTWVYNEAVEDYAFDPDLARTMLAQAGWEDHDGDGVLDRDGRDFAFTILTNQGNSARIKTATIIQHQLAQVGIAVKVRAIEWASFLAEFVDKGRFEAVVLGWRMPPDPDAYNVWHSSKADGGLNFIHYASLEADAALEAGRRTLDQAERKRQYDRLQEILHRDQPYCFLYASYSLPMVHSRFQGVSTGPLGIEESIIRWWIPADRQRVQW